MGYFDEMKKAAADGDATVGEPFTYDGTTGFTGFFGDDDPEVIFARTGKETQRALICDASKAQFTRKKKTPTRGKLIVYDGQSFVIRQVHPIGGDQWRFHIYIP